MTFKSVKVLPNNILVVERNLPMATEIGFDGDLLATIQGDTLFTICKTQEKPADNDGAKYEPGDR